MEVFVTGGTGYIGEAVVSALIAAGHTVTALARSEASASQLRRAGAIPVRGSLDEPGTYQAATVSADALVHTAFDYRGGVDKDRAALETLLGTAAGSTGDCTVVYTSGVWVLGDTGDGPATEDAQLDPVPLVRWRPPHEEKVLAASSDRVATAVVRPGVVFGGAGGLVDGFFRSAEENGAAEIVGEGDNRWSLIHREDLGRFYLRVVESRGRGIFHATDGHAPTVGQVAEAASQAVGAGGAVRKLALGEAREKLGPMADALVLDQVVASARGEELGWRAERPPFVAAADVAYREWCSARSAD